MARDFPIRIDLAKLGIPERTIRVLEKAALLVQLIEEQTALQGEVAAIDSAVDANAEAIEDANLSLASLDGRVDTLEVGAPYVSIAGDTMTGALNVNALLECDTFRLNTAEAVAAAVASTHKVAVNINGGTYYILLSNV